MGYDYDKMMTEISDLNEKHREAKCFKIGRSHMGRDIMCIEIGAGGKRVLALGAFHGLEYITSAFLVEFASRLCGAAQAGREFFGRDAALLCKNTTLYIVPMVNPDGVDIAQNGLDEENPYHKRLRRLVGGIDFKKEWQANARGVDINHNFAADWDKTKEKPSPSKYGGAYPNSEAETRAVVDFVRRERIDMLLAFHSQGEEIYYDFKGKTAPRSLETAKALAKESGYKLAVPEGTAAYGGCKDWFIQELGKEGFTIEMGKGRNPLPMSMLKYVYEPNAKIILKAMEEVQ